MKMMNGFSKKSDSLTEWVGDKITSREAITSKNGSSLNWHRQLSLTLSKILAKRKSGEIRFPAQSARMLTNREFVNFLHTIVSHSQQFSQGSTRDYADNKS